MTPSRVTLVVGSATGGMATHVRMLAAGLARSGTKVQVLAPAAVMKSLALTGIAGVCVSPVEVGGRPSPADVRTLLRLRRLLAASGADVVHAHGLRAGALCALATIPSPRPRSSRDSPDAAGGPGAAMARVRDASSAGSRGGDAATAASGPGAAAGRVGDAPPAGGSGVGAGRVRDGVIAAVGTRWPPLVVTVHNAPPAGSAAALVYRVLERIVAARAALVLCVSPDLEARLRKAGARNVGRALVPAPAAPQAPEPGLAQAPGPVAGPAQVPAPDMAHVPVPDPASPAATASAFPPGRRPVVLAVGRLTAQKGLGMLLAAAASWRDMDPAPQVVIAGEGPLLADLRDQAATLGVDARFVGHRDDVPALLAACDVFVLPSRWEGQPLILQEALRAGAAIVATRTGGIPDLAGPEAAYLVAPGDVPQLASGVRAVLLDCGLAVRLRVAARRRAAALPAEQDAVAAVRSAYAEAVAADG